MAKSAVSELDARLLRERLAALTGGIAKLTVVGSSSGELRERKDRADDAIRAVQGAVKHGVLPGGGWTLIKVARHLEQGDHPPAVKFVLVPALYEPVKKLLANTGMPDDEVRSTIDGIISAQTAESKPVAYNAAKGEFVDAFKDGLLDSTPAVREAVRNSISIATLLGTLGGICVQERDREFERRESQASADFVRNAGVNEANERW